MLQTIKIPARNACLQEIRLFSARSSALFFPKENTAETISISHIHITPLYFQSVTGVTFSTYQISSMADNYNIISECFLNHIDNCCFSGCGTSCNPDNTYSIHTHSCIYDFLLISLLYRNMLSNASIRHIFLFLYKVSV